MNIAIIGGTGTTGTILIDALLKTNIKTVTSISRDEHKINIMKRRLKDCRVNYIISDVRDYESINSALNNIDIVVHCAALKHVTTGEHFPLESVKTNVIGTGNVIKACKNNNVDKLIFMSTDKAVEPCNVYGMTKHIAEKMVLNDHDLNTCVIRSGNILGSRGSIIPYFKWLISQNKVVPITDIRMKRWFISKESLTRLLLEIIEGSIDKAVYIPKMNLIKIIDVVKKLNCEYKVIGKQDGEKLTERLFWDYEKPVGCDKYFIVR